MDLSLKKISPNKKVGENGVISTRNLRTTEDRGLK